MSQSQINSPELPLVKLINDRPATTSLKIAGCFGKRHCDVMRDIQNLIENCPSDFNERNFALVEYKDAKGEMRPMYTVYFDGFILLVMGYTGKKALQVKLAYIEAFNAMNEQLNKLEEQERARLAGETKEIPDASRVSKRTDPERKALTAIINTWVGLAPIHYASARAQVNAHFGVASVDALTVAQVKEALRFVQGKIDALPPVVTEPVRLPMYRDGIFHSVHTDKNHVAGPREEALKDFWSKEYGPQSAALEDKFREMLDAIDKAAGADLFSYAVSAIGRDADTSFGVSCLLDGMYAAKYMARSAFKDAMSYLCLHMRMATSVATALNR